MFKGKRSLAITLILAIVLSSLAVFAAGDKQEIKWLEVPTVEKGKNKKIDVTGKLYIPEGFKGSNKVKLTVNGFNVVPKNDGSFSKSLNSSSELEVVVKVFVGKEEVEDLRRVVYYVENTTKINEVIKMIDRLPELENIRLYHKEEVQKVRLAYEALTEIEKKFVTNLDKLISIEEKIAYLEKEANDKYFFPAIYMHEPESLATYPYSEIYFEGYITNIKYLEKVLVGGEEADVEYVENAVVKDLSGNIVHRGPAYKFSKTLILEDGAQAISVEVVSQSGQKGSIARRFWVDTTPPELNITVKDRDPVSDKATLEINMKDNLGYLDLYLYDSHIYHYERNYSYPVDTTFEYTVDLGLGENEFVFTLVDGAGHKTVETVTITREELKTGIVQISLFKDSTSGQNKIDFDTIYNFYIKNKKTGEVFNIGSKPWNDSGRLIMENIPEGEYTIHFHMPEVMYVKQILLGESYKETVYDPDTNPLVVIDKGKTPNYVKIVLRSEIVLKEIKPLDNLVVPANITYNELLDLLPKTITIVDSNDVEHAVEIKWDLRPYVFDSWKKPGTYTVFSEFFQLPLLVSNTEPATRLQVDLKVTFE